MKRALMILACALTAPASVVGAQATDSNTVRYVVSGVQVIQRRTPASIVVRSEELV